MKILDKNNDLEKLLFADQYQCKYQISQMIGASNLIHNST